MVLNLNSTQLSFDLKKIDQEVIMCKFFFSYKTKREPVPAKLSKQKSMMVITLCCSEFYKWFI